jgi:hypothetical protein
LGVEGLDRKTGKQENRKTGKQENREQGTGNREQQEQRHIPGETRD